MISKYNKVLFTAIFLLLNTSFVFSAEVLLTTDSDSINPLDIFVITLTVLTEGNEKIVDFEVDADDNFIINQTVVSSSTIIVNQDIKARNLYLYSAYSQSSGSYLITANVNIQKNGISKYISDTLVIYIEGDSTDNIIHLSNGNLIPSISYRKPVLLDMNISDTSPYPNEQIIAELRCYSKFKFQKAPIIILPPAFQGFWVETIDTNFTYQAIRTDNGIIYKYIYRWALFPIQTGNVTIGRSEVEVIVSKSSLLPRRLTLTTKPIEIFVKSLPAAGIPENFSGSVGTFFIDINVPDSLHIDSTGSVEIIISGFGNIRGIGKIDISETEEATFYPFESEISLNNNDGILFGQRKELFHLTAENPGQVIIPSIQFSYYDPDLENYVISETDPCSVIVIGTKCYIEPDYNDNDSIDNITSISSFIFPSPERYVNSIIYLFSLLLILFSIAIYIFKNIVKNPNYSKKISGKTAKKYLQHAVKNQNSSEINLMYENLKSAIIVTLRGGDLVSLSLMEINEEIRKIISSDKYRTFFQNWEKIEYSGLLNINSDFQNNRIINTKKDIETVKEIIKKVKSAKRILKQH